MTVLEFPEMMRSYDPGSDGTVNSYPKQMKYGVGAIPRNMWPSLHVPYVEGTELRFW